MFSYKELAERIISEQAIIIGPIAWIEASKVNGIVIIDDKNGVVEITGNGKSAIEQLVLQFDRLFGQTSREVCKSAVRDLIGGASKDAIPDVLK